MDNVGDVGGGMDVVMSLEEVDFGEDDDGAFEKSMRENANSNKGMILMILKI